MGRFLILLLLLIVPLVCRGDGWFYGSAAAAEDYSDILFWWTCESANLGADDYYGEGDSTATASPGTSIGTDGVKVGTNGLILPSTYDYYAFDVANLIDVNEGRCGFYFRINTFAAGIALFQVNASDGYIKLDVADGGGGNGDYDISFKWRDSSTTRTALVTSSNLSSGTWYYVEAAWDVTANTREVWIDGVSVGSSSAAINAHTGATAIWIGNNTASDGSLYIDNVAISDDASRDLEALKDLTASPR